MRRRLFPDSDDNNKKSGPSRSPANSASSSAAALLEEEGRHEDLAKELLKLTSSLKHNFSRAGSVLKEDNQALDVMQGIALSNKENLVRERARLRHHAYQSCFNCVMILTVCLVVWSFIAMIIIMRVFPKN